MSSIVCLLILYITNQKSPTMRKVFILLITLVSLFSHADTNEIVLGQKGQLPNREGLPMNFDIPRAYYYYDAKTQEIIIDGGGAVSYYDVEISSPVTNYVEISTQVDGTYDTIDITSLAPGAHVITIESPSGNIYEGTFISY